MTAKCSSSAEDDEKSLENRYFLLDMEWPLALNAAPLGWYRKNRLAAFDAQVFARGFAGALARFPVGSRDEPSRALDRRDVRAMRKEILRSSGPNALF
jgi:hypothetical protein